MTRQLSAERGLLPHWKVRVVFDGAVLHFASAHEPAVRTIGAADDRVDGITWELLVGPDYGDTLGYIDWGRVSAISWRYAP